MIQEPPIPLPSTERLPVRVAVLDLYDGQPNQGMRCFRDILDRYREKHQLDLSYETFDVRKGLEVPGTEFDVYISSGGPGSPLDSEGSEWEEKYFGLIDRLWAHNLVPGSVKKHVFFVCHSFQLLCRKYGLGEVCLRQSPSFGVLPVHRTPVSYDEPVLEGLPDPFYIVDSRHWQVIRPQRERLEAFGATVLVLEKERPHRAHLEQCIMAMRFNAYFFGTQFHPEADPEGMKAWLLTEEKKAEVIAGYGQAKYQEMLEGLEDPDKIKLTQSVLIPNFLNQAIPNLQEA